jgi:4-amino-4-deoxy-L-arabinose transferase-like glycosyltransferase
MFVVNAIFNMQFQLHYDEAYYWVWGQNLSLSYYDHPPMVAYLIRLASYFGYKEFIVRLPALFCSVSATYVIYLLAKRMFGNRVADISLILAFSCPIIQAVAFIMTPDSPLILFWALTLYCFYIGVFEDKPLHIYLAGVFAGCALLSKYTAILIFPGLFLFLITSSEYRRVLTSIHIYIAFILAVLIFSPVLIWNYEHSWVSFIYQFNHGIDTNNSIQMASFFDYLGGQVIMVGPFVFMGILYYGIKYFKPNIANPKLSFLFWPLAFGLVFFAFCSTTKHMEANWPGPIYISSVILVAYYLVKNNVKWLYRASLVFIVIVLLVTKFPIKFTPRAFHNKVPGIDIFYGNKELLSNVVPYINGKVMILACDYGNASRIWFYLGARTYVLEQLPFSNSYRYWQQPALPIDNAIYICGGEDKKALEKLGLYFKNIKLLKKATFSNVITDNHIYIYQVSN